MSNTITLFGIRITLERVKLYQVFIHEVGPCSFVIRSMASFPTLAAAVRASKRKLKQFAMDTDVNHFAVIYKAADPTPEEGPEKTRVLTISTLMERKVRFNKVK